MSRVKTTSLRHFPTHCENSRGAGTATWRLNTSREDFRFSLVLLVEREKYNSLTSSLRGLDDFLSPLVRDLGLEPRSQLRRRIYCPLILAVSVFRTKTHFVRFRCVYHSANPLIFINLISLLTFVILSITFNHIQSVGRHGLSIG